MIYNEAVDFLKMTSVQGLLLSSASPKLTSQDKNGDKWVVSFGGLTESFKVESDAVLWFFSCLNSDCSDIHQPGITNSQFITYDLAYLIKKKFNLKNLKLQYSHSKVDKNQPHSKTEQIIFTLEKRDNFVLKVISEMNIMRVEFSNVSKKVLAFSFEINNINGFDQVGTGFRSRDEFFHGYSDYKKSKLDFESFLQSQLKP